MHGFVIWIFDDILQTVIMVIVVNIVEKMIGENRKNYFYMVGFPYTNNENILLQF